MNIIQSKKKSSWASCRQLVEAALDTGCCQVTCAPVCRRASSERFGEGVAQGPTLAPWLDSGILCKRILLTHRQRFTRPTLLRYSGSLWGAGQETRCSLTRERRLGGEVFMISTPAADSCWLVGIWTELLALKFSGAERQTP